MFFGLTSIVCNDAKIFIVGKNPPYEIKKLQSDDIIFTGPQYELKKFLSTMEVAMMPLVYGSGQNGKIAEAMINQIPVITNTIGAFGIQLQNGFDALIGNKIEEIVDNYLHIINMNENEYDSLIKNAYYSAKEKFNSKMAKSKLLKVFNSL